MTTAFAAFVRPLCAQAERLAAAAFAAMLGLALMTGGGSLHPAAAQPAQAAPTVLITGSNRGIGFGLVRQYAFKGWTVIATARHPETADDLKAFAAEHPNVRIERLDVTDLASIEAVAEKYRGTPIDVLINNAGILGSIQDQTLGSFDYDTLEQVLDVNTIGPLRVASAFLDHVAASEQKKIMTVTSGLGSMALAQHFGGYYYYRISKAGVNMAMRVLRADVRDQGIVVGLVSPGIVDTDLNRESGNSRKGITPDESARGLVEVIDAMTIESSNAMINYDGGTIPW